NDKLKRIGHKNDKLKRMGHSLPERKLNLARDTTSLKRIGHRTEIRRLGLSPMAKDDLRRLSGHLSALDELPMRYTARRNSNSSSLGEAQ
ncbi:MAG TPA: hypothetical protein VIG25_21400, partial [Pyrinomonadaceae bacterium]